MSTLGYSITGQNYANERQSDGTYAQMVNVSFETKTTPPVSGMVSVPQSLLKDKVAYHDAVKTAVETAVEAHESVAGLGS